MALGLVLLLFLGAGPSSAASGDTVEVGGTPLSVVIGPDGTAYVGDYRGAPMFVGRVGVLTAGASSPSEYLTTGYGVAGLAMSADATLFADGWDSGKQQELIGVIPKGAHSVARTIPVSPGAHLIAAATDGTLYAPNHGSNTVSIIPPGADAVAREIPVPAGPREVAVTKDGTAYVTSQEAGTVSVIPEGATAVSQTIQVSATAGTTDNPHGIAIAPDGSVYVANISGDAVAVIKPAGTTVAYRVPVPQGPKEVAVGGDGLVYVLTSAQSLCMIRQGDSEVARCVVTSTNPGHLAVAPNGSVIVTNTTAGTISVFGPGLPIPNVPGSGQPAPAPAQTAAAAQQAERTGGNTDDWGNTPAVLGLSAATLLAAAAVLVVGARRRRHQAVYVAQVEPERAEPARVVGAETSANSSNES